MASLVVKFLVLSAIVGLAQCSQIKAKITPSTPSAFKDRKITMNCTLESQVGSDVSARNLSFSWTNPELKEKSVTRVIDNRTINLLISKVHLNMSSARISCILGNDTLDEVAIVVDEPRFPSDPKCVVYNWASMICTWERDEDDNRTILLAYTRMCLKPTKLFACPLELRERGHRNCTWNAWEPNKNTFMRVDHCLFYRVTNAFNASAMSFGIRIKVEEIVKPNAVTSFTATSVTASHVELRWSSPSDHRKLINYRVAYESRVSNILIKNTTATSIHLSNLIPNTYYTFSIDCIPIVKDVATGFWSDKKEIQVTTKPDADFVKPIKEEKSPSSHQLSSIPLREVTSDGQQKSAYASLGKDRDRNENKSLEQRQKAKLKKKSRP